MKTPRRVTWAVLAPIIALAFMSAVFFAQQPNTQLSQSGATAASQSAKLGAQLWLNILPYGQQIFGVQGDLNDPKVLYATTARGLYKTVNAGMVWQPLYVIDASFLTFAQSSSSPNVMYLGVATRQGRGGVFKSITRGTTWEQIGAQDIQLAVSSISIDPKNADIVFVLVNSTGVLFKSLNAGRTWGNVAPNVATGTQLGFFNTQLSFFVVDPFEPGHLFANHSKERDHSNLWESRDGGLSWEHRDSSIVVTPNRAIASNWTALLFHPTDRSLIVGTAGGDAWGGQAPPILAVSRDGGNSWRDARIVETRPAPNYRETAEMQSLAWSNAASGTLYAGTSESLYVSSDYGQSWLRILPYGTSDIVSVGKEDLYAVTSAGLLKSKSGGKGWHHAGLGLPTSAGIVGTGVPPMDVFEAFQEGHATNLFSLQAISGDDVYVSGSGGFLSTTDGGLSWSWHSVPSDVSTGISSDIIPQSRGPNIRQLLVAKDKTVFLNVAARGAFGSGESQILKVRPDGKITRINIRNRGANIVAISPANSGVLYVTTSEGMGEWSYSWAGKALMKSTDGGFSWETFDLVQPLGQRLAGSELSGIHNVAVSRTSPDTVYVLLSLRNPNLPASQQWTVRLETTSNGGNTWTDITPKPLAAVTLGTVFGLDLRSAISIDPGNDKIAYLALNERIFRSRDQGSTWTELPIKAGLINDVSVNTDSSELLYVASDSGAWMSANAGASWTPISSGLRQEKLKKVISAGSVTITQGYNGIYRLSDSDLTWARSRWQEFEVHPESNPITFTPVTSRTARSDSPTPGMQAQARTELGSAEAPNPASPATGCGDYDGCLQTALDAYRSKDWPRAVAAFQDAANRRPTSGEPWIWLGRTLFRDGQRHQLQDLARVWDKALSLGAEIRIGACHERTLQFCERGDLSLSAKSISFLANGTRPVFAAAPSEIEPGRILNNSAAAHIAYSLKVAGKNYSIDFIPLGSTACTFNLMVQCPQEGITEQLILAQYVSQTLPKLARGALNATDTAR